jgi:amino acid adenylation domain-containing protein
MSNGVFQAGALSADQKDILQQLLWKKGIDVSQARRIPRREKRLHYQLSFAQQRLWFLDQLAPGNHFYNIPAAVRLQGRLDVKAFERSLNEVVNRHEVLRTTFPAVDGQPVQSIAPALPFTMPVIDLREFPQDAREARARLIAAEEAQRPFDLAEGPLLRARLLRLGDEDYVALLTMHHIVSDGWSMGVLVREVAALYEAYSHGRQSPLEELPIQYADYAAWQREWLSGEVLESQLAYWKERLAGVAPILELPSDHPRPAVQSHRGASQAVALPQSLTEQLKALSQRQGGTLFMTLLAAFQTLLMRYTGRQDVVVGSPIANRGRAEIEGLIGFFVNTLALRTDLSGDPPFVELLGRVKEVALGAYAHQDLPLERLVEELQPERDLSRHPLFQVMMVLQNAPREAVELPGLRLSMLPSESGTTKFDLTLSLAKGEGGLTGLLEYSTDLFEAETIRRMLGHYQRLLESVVADPQRRLSELELLTEAEREQLVVEWNRTRSDYPREQSIRELFERQVELTPDRTAVAFEEEQLSYAELNRRANRLANYLRSLGVEPDTRVCILMERSVEIVVGVLGVLKAGGAYVPLDPSSPEERLAFMVEDAGARVILTQRRLTGVLPRFQGEVVRLDAELDEIATQSDENPRNLAQPDNLAYVIYTSGSTGRPKGVLVSHRNLIHSIYSHTLYYREPVTHFFLTSPFAFDSSVTGIFWTLCSGGCLIIPPESFQQDLLKLNEVITQRQVSHLVWLPSLYNLLLKQSGSEQLSILRTVILAGEPCQRILIEQHNALLPQTSLFNEYGPTEGTVWSSVYDCKTEDPGGAVPIGRPIPNVSIYSLDRWMNPMPIGAAGELYIGGEGLARGYLERPDLTAERFIPHPFSKESGARLYRTGDLARYLPDANLEFLGRFDDQVKLRGYRIELGEIEAALREHPRIREAVVLARQDSTGEKRLVAYIVPDREPAPTVSEARAFLKERLPDYMVPSAFVTLDELPLTPNGKVDRRALPAPDQARPDVEAAYVAPRTPAEEVIAGIWSQVLGVERVGVYDNFFELGGHSLLATQVISRVRGAFQVEAPLRSLFEGPTVAELAQGVEAGLRAGLGTQAPAIARVSREREIPLSFAQQRLWFLDQLVPGNPFYNLPEAVRLLGPLDAAALERSLQAVVQRHEALRTTFTTVDSQPLQVISPTQTVTLAAIDLREVPEIERETEAQHLARKEAQRPFNLAEGPLLRATLLRLGDEDHVALLSMHHIVSDGWSMGVLVREVGAFYEAYSQGRPSPLEELPIQYADYAAWQREWLSGEVLNAQLTYWKRQLAGLSVLNLPTDHPRPVVQSYRGAMESLMLSKELRNDLVALSRRENVTLFMTLLAAFQVLLQRYTGQDDVTVGTPIANRNRAEVEGLIGFFANMLALRVDFSKASSFRERLGHVREVALGAYAHQDLPFEKLVEELQPEREMGRHPLFQVTFALQNAPKSDLAITGVTSGDFRTDSQTTRFDLEVYLWERPEGLACSLVYSTDLFEAATIRRMLGHYRRLLESVVADPQRRLSKLELLTEAEREQLLVEWNRTQNDYPREQPIHELFEQHVELTPERVAVAYDNEQLSYAELNGWANRLAHFLRGLGVGPEVRTGILMERSVEMVVGVLGVLKAGGAYVPLDPAYPEERLAFMVEDAGVRALLTQQRFLRGGLPSQQAQVVCLDEEWEKIAAQPAGRLEYGSTAENLAYVIYTSGSTGRPKGVMVEQRSVVNLLEGLERAVYRGGDEVRRVAMNGPLWFDGSVKQLMQLAMGRSVYIVGEEERRDGEMLVKKLVVEGVEVVDCTPMQLRMMQEAGGLAVEGSQVKKALVGGEAIGEGLWEEIKRDERVIYYNVYGPTECTVDATLCQVVRGEEGVNIGSPIGNVRVYILDEEGEVAPVGVRGEIHIAGMGVARGYLGEAGMTAERFVPDPYGGRAGERMYRSGDFGRYREDGKIVYEGRRDQQVKVLGYRIELGEIEAVLRRHPGVREAAAIARQDAPGEKRLVAYVVQNTPYQSARESVSETQWQIDQIAQWQIVFDEVQSQALPTHDSTFNIIGWNSSYTGQLIPDEEMREWLDSTVERITSLRPSRVLEIGCGTGLLLFQIAPACTQYCGADFSQVTLKQLERQLAEAGRELPPITLLHRTADNFEGIDAEAFDTVILNSVVQYFPSIDYLLRVLEGAVKAVKAGGFIFIGDVRSLPLLKAFHASVLLSKADPSLSKAQFLRQVQKQMFEEEELVIAPAFFNALKRRLPKISRVQVQLKRGRHHNELTRFRYDVILHVGSEVEPASDFPWLDWQEQKLTLADVKRLLEDTAPQKLGFARVPNARVRAEIETLEWLASDQGPETVGEYRQSLREPLLEPGLDPEQMWSLSHDAPYAIDISWSNSDSEGRYDVVFRRLAASEGGLYQEAISGAPVETTGSEPWSAYANNPLRGKLTRQIVPQLRRFLKERLPEYMIPSAFVVLESLPLTPNGKIDRRALPAPDQSRPEMEKAYVAPSSPVEEVLAELWANVLGIERVGVHDNFFDLGGHSLLATQLISRARNLFQVELPLRWLFEANTVDAFSQTLIANEPRPGQTVKVASAFKKVKAMKLEERESRLRMKRG